MKILAIESSCDETGVAVVEDGRKILSNEVLSQIEIHARYGGVVPEIASRAHTEAITPLTRAALEKAGTALSDIDAIAVTAKPGLIGALLVGLSFAKGLSYSTGIPLVGVNHMRGHIAAGYLGNRDLEPPFTAFVLSGGHTSVIRVNDYTDFTVLGCTRDDAAGEAFDKVARVLSIDYPGGREMDALASKGDPSAYDFPSPIVRTSPFDFSFSGIKTAVINRLHNDAQKGVAFSREDVAASFTASVVRALCDRMTNVIDSGADKLLLCGGVAANTHVRAALVGLCESRGVRLYLTPSELCGDNGAMIGSQGYYEYLAGNISDISLNSEAQSEI